MHRNEFLDLSEIKEFTSFLAELISGDEGSFTHEYKIENVGKAKNNNQWGCESIYEAFIKYRWPFNYYDHANCLTKKGTSFYESETELGRISHLLRRALVANNNVEAASCCQMVLDWGGVLGSSKSGNKKKLDDLGADLNSYLSCVKALFDSEEIGLRGQYDVSIGGKPVPVIMNAGFTKIYSILCKDFIIYDGRVGAALGLLVRKFLECNSYSKEVPSSLAFHYGRARNRNVNRNPSADRFLFPSLSTSSPAHIRSNLKANWILQNISHNGAGQFSSLTEPLRGIEAALFMIGYKV